MVNYKPELIFVKMLCLSPEVGVCQATDHLLHTECGRTPLQLFFSPSSFNSDEPEHWTTYGIDGPVPNPDEDVVVVPTSRVLDDRHLHVLNTRVQPLVDADSLEYLYT